MCIATMPAASTATSAGLPRIEHALERDLDHVVSADRHAGAAEEARFGPYFATALR
jgi:hypothetical protein